MPARDDEYVWAQGERVTEQQNRHKGPMQTADDQQTSTQISNLVFDPKIEKGFIAWIKANLVFREKLLEPLHVLGFKLNLRFLLVFVF